MSTKKNRDYHINVLYNGDASKLILTLDSEVVFPRSYKPHFQRASKQYLLPVDSQKLVEGSPAVVTDFKDSSRLAQIVDKSIDSREYVLIFRSEIEEDVAKEMLKTLVKLNSNRTPEQ